jgi:hypothetical protein
MNLRFRILSSFLVGGHSAFLDKSSLEKVEALFNHIEFHQSTITLFWIRYGVQFKTMKTVPVERMTSTVEKISCVSFGTSRGQDSAIDHLVYILCT